MAALVTKSIVVIECYRGCWVRSTFSSPIGLGIRESLASFFHITVRLAGLGSIRSVKELAGPFC
jgi:hypothetical protein